MKYVQHIIGTEVLNSLLLFLYLYLCCCCLHAVDYLSGWVSFLKFSYLASLNLIQYLQILLFMPIDGIKSEGLDPYTP